MTYQDNVFKINPSAVMTLADLVAAVEMSGHSIQARRNMKSAIGTFCRVVGKTPETIAAKAEELLTLLEAVDPASGGIGDVRWNNVRSDFRRALKLAGLIEAHSASIPVTQGWQEIVNLAPDANQRSSLRRWARFCDSIGIQPAGVSDAEIDAFRDMLEADQRSKAPARIADDVIRFWNRLSESQPHLGLPLLTKSDKSRTYVLPWEAFPASLEADVVAFCSPGGITSWFERDGRKAFSPETSFAYNRYLRRFASALVLAGIDPASLEKLADVVTPPNARRGLEWLIERNGGEINVQVHYLAVLCLKVARHWAMLDETSVATLAAWANNFAEIKPRGMTAKNRERLRQFTGGKVLSALINMPESIFAELEGKPVTPHRARLARDAVMAAILTIAPMRLKNLRHLDRVEHFRAAFSIDANRWEMVLPAAQVKNDIDLAYPVPPRVMEMIDHYMAAYQPLLAGNGSTKIFPGGRGGRTFGDAGARLALQRLLKRRLELAVNPHLFRHLGAFIFLKAHPGQYEPVRRLLGHKKLETTIQFYASFDTDDAMRRYGTVLDELCQATAEG